MNIKQNNECRIGVRIVLEDGRSGVIRFLGPTKFKEGIWAGIELDGPLGRNDGKINGYRYFYCPPNHGIFVHPSKVSLACGGPNFGDIIESTPVKNPLTFPSFDQKIFPDKANYNEYKSKQIEVVSNNYDSKDYSDKDARFLNDKINLLNSSIRHLEKENFRLQKQISESQKYSVPMQSLNKKCTELKGKIKNIKEYFIELNAAKSRTEEFFESELIRYKHELEKRLNYLPKSGTRISEDFWIEKNNMSLYLDWIFGLRRNKLDRETSLSSTSINSNLVDLNNNSIKSLEKIYANIKKLVETFSNFKKSYAKSFNCNGSDLKYFPIEDEKLFQNILEK